MRQRLAKPVGRLAAEALAGDLDRGEELRREGEALEGDRQGGEVELLAAVLVLAAVDQAQLDGLLQLEQEGALLRDGLFRVGFGQGRRRR